jgi:hypothetical protein
MRKIINGKEYMKVLHCCLPVWLEADENGDCNLEGFFVTPAIWLGRLIPGLGVEDFGGGNYAFKFLPYQSGDFYLKVLFRSFYI